MKCVGIFFLCLLFLQTAWASESAQSLFQIRAHEPSFSQIISAALRHQDFSDSRVHEWKRRLNKAAYLPVLSFGYDRALKDTDTVKISDNISVTSDAVNVGPQESDWNQSAVSGDVFRVRASWDFSKAVYSNDLISISREQRDLAKQELQLSDYLFKIVGKRHELLSEYVTSSAKSSIKMVKTRELILDLTDQLDAWTGGEFVRQWWRPK